MKPINKPSIKTYKPESEYFFEEGCFIVELHNSPDDPQVSVARARVSPGETTQWHSLEDTWERYVIQAGIGQVEVGELAVTKVQQGDVVVIPPGVPQRISNCGDEDLVFLAICSPRFEACNYRIEE
ncbi:Cupin domain-containing protein [Alteromonadaceae bacterium Bs31]|nr:Cupin domain-containing protein [Alteromonadaceae bacterium Bs31]